MKLRLFILILINYVLLANLFANSTSVTEINNFIKEHSSIQTLGKSEYWARIEIKNGLLIIHNRPLNIGRLTVPIDKINKIKVKNDKLIITTNVEGKHVTRLFANKNKQIEKAHIKVLKMSKANRKLLKKMLKELLQSQTTAGSSAVTLAESTDSSKLETINQLIIHHFINFELSQKNGNLSTIYSYVDRFPKNNVGHVSMSSNLGGQDESIDFHYDQTGLLKHINYLVDRGESKGPILFKYDLIYSGQKPVSIHVKGREKYKLNYKGPLLTSISFRRRNIEKIYNMAYTENRVDFKSDVIRDGKAYYFTNEQHSGMATDYLEWNKNYQMTSYELDIFKGADFQYNSHGDEIAFGFSNTKSSDNQANWSYTRDDQNNWITQTNQALQIKRTISYQTVSSRPIGSTQSSPTNLNQQSSADSNLSRDSSNSACNAMSSQDSNNLALRANVKAGSTYCADSGKNCYSAARVNDGDTSTALGGYTSWTNVARQSKELKFDWNDATVDVAKIHVFTTENYPISAYEILGKTRSGWKKLVEVSGNIKASICHEFEPVSITKLKFIGQKGPASQKTYTRVNEIIIQ